VDPDSRPIIAESPEEFIWLVKVDADGLTLLGSLQQHFYGLRQEHRIRRQPRGYIDQ
jgi:hypothetical protein